MSNTQETPSVESMPKRRGRFADFFIRLLKEKPLGMLGGVIILLLIGLSLFADALAPYPYNRRSVVPLGLAEEEGVSLSQQ